MYPNYRIDIARKTVTHTETGVILSFVECRDGGWIDYIATDSIFKTYQLTTDQLYAITSRAKAAWANAHYLAKQSLEVIR